MNHGSHTPLQDEGDEAFDGSGTQAVDSETLAQKQKQKQTVVSVDREHRDGCARCLKPGNGGQVWVLLLTMNGSWGQGCVCTLNCLSFVDLSAIQLTSLALKVRKPRERRSVKIYTCCRQ